MFKPKAVYRHLANRDVAMEVIRCFYIKEKDHYRLHVRWLNIGHCHDPWDMGVYQGLTVEGADRKSWVSFEGRLPKGVYEQAISSGGGI